MASVQHTYPPTPGAFDPSTDSTWGKRKPTHLAPIGSDPSARTRKPSVLSSAPSLVSNAPSTNSGSSFSDAPSENTQRRATLERLRRKLGEEVPAEAVFASSPSPRSPRMPRTAVPKSSPRGRARSRSRSRTRQRSTHLRAEDAQSITISISSDEGVQTVTLTPGTTHVRTRSRSRSPHHRHHSHKQKHAYPTSGLPPVPPIPAHFSSSRQDPANDEDDTGLIRPRQKMPAGSKIGGADFKAARRAKREGRTGQADVGEMVEMLSFLGNGRF
ncbi:hypothetical protein ID866_4806 [Astraeus odoratus]|nr:hypothetical protein ID866_4806 [Astraeus odoratus]